MLAKHSTRIKQTAGGPICYDLQNTKTLTNNIPSIILPTTPCRGGVGGGGRAKEKGKAGTCCCWGSGDLVVARGLRRRSGCCSLPTGSSLSEGVRGRDSKDVGANGSRWVSKESGRGKDTQVQTEGTDCQFLVLILRRGLFLMTPENGTWQACLNGHPDHTQITYVLSAGRNPTICGMYIV